MFSAQSQAKAGSFGFLITNGGNHPPEKWSELAVRRVVQVADTAPPPIRDQAHAFREQVRGTFTYYLAQALGAQRRDLADKLEREGMRAAAAFIRNQGD